MQETTETHFTKSTQLTFYYKEFKFRNNSIASNQISQSNNINEDNFNEQFTSFDLMDFLPNNSINVESTQYQMNEQINVYQTNKKQEWVRIFEMNIF
jgi:roadblock/LC7 domain-containing protein